MILTRPLRKPLWILGSFFKKHQKLILIAFSLSLFILLFSKNLIPLLPKLKPSEKIGIVGQYTMNNLPLSVSQTISRGLTKTDQNGQVIPDIAKSWQVLEEETLYKIYLNPEILWNDGSILQSEDIQIEIPEVNISYPDKYIIEFKLKEPYSPFLSLLSRPLFKDKTIGIGNYIIKKIKTKGPYLKSLELAGSKQNLTYRFYPSHQSAWLGFKLGEVDQLENIILNPLDDKWQKKVNLEQKINLNQYLAIIFNLQDPQLGNKPLRQALAYAIKEKAPDQELRALSPISPNSFTYNPKVKQYNFNVDQAKELFETATEEASISGKLEISLGTSQPLLTLAESIAQSWEETLPVKVEVKIINFIEPDFQAILIAQEIPLDPDQHALWHSTQNSNISHYSDLKIDKLLEDGRKISDPEKRKEIYQDFQRFLVEDSPAIFLQHPITYTLSRH